MVTERYRLNHTTVVQAACQAVVCGTMYTCKPLASCLLTEHGSANITVLVNLSLTNTVFNLLGVDSTGTACSY